jgi:hypothetical protein
MALITLLIKINLKRRKYLRDMIAAKNHTVVMRTKDGRQGKRFLFRHGKFSTDDVLDDFDLAFIWKDGDTAFKVFTANDPTAMHQAMANWDLEMEGDESLSVWFPIFLGYATGVLKK